MRDFNSRRVLFDTNALLDAVDKNRPGCQDARGALLNCNGGGDMGLVAALSLKDAYYILSKRFGESKARNAVRGLMDQLVIMPVGAEECILSVDSNEPDFEDGMIRAAAELNEVDFILTRDAAAFRLSRIRKLTCKEYLEIVESERSQPVL